MTSKKGIAVTIGILAAITLASFVIWFIPSGTNQTSFIVSDHEANLDGVKSIHQAIQESIEEDFQKMLDREITPAEYKERAEVASSQLKSQIIQMMQSDPPEEWKASYQSYLEALRTSNSYIRETKVIATMIQDSENDEKVSEDLESLAQIQSEAKELVEKSNQARP